VTAVFKRNIKVSEAKFSNNSKLWSKKILGDTNLISKSGLGGQRADASKSVFTKRLGPKLFKPKICAGWLQRKKNE